MHALEVSSESERQIGVEALKEGNLAPVLQLIDETNAVHHATELAKTYVERAKSTLETVDLKNDKLLNKVADFVLERIH
ncbi:MAG: hypothetical protein ACW97O_16390 [Candidatus Thorarchaeota archaeon]